MKQADVVIGEIYVTKVSGVLRKVRVMAKLDSSRYGNKRQTKFVVVRVTGRGNPIQPRSAAALRRIPGTKTQAEALADKLAKMGMSPETITAAIAAMK